MTGRTADGPTSVGPTLVAARTICKVPGVGTCDSRPDFVGLLLLYLVRDVYLGSRLDRTTRLSKEVIAGHIADHAPASKRREEGVVSRIAGMGYLRGLGKGVASQDKRRCRRSRIPTP